MGAVKGSSRDNPLFPSNEAALRHYEHELKETLRSYDLDEGCDWDGEDYYPELHRLFQVVGMLRNKVNG